MASEASSSRAATARKRLKRIVLVVLGALVFLTVSGLLARWFTVQNLERDMDLELVQAEARGDAAAMIDKLSGCRSSASCRANVRHLIADPRVRRSGSVKILDFESQTGNSLSGATGKTRFAWTVIGTLPVNVQCIDVRRTGNFLSGIDVRLLSISPPISNEGDC